MDEQQANKTATQVMAEEGEERERKERRGNAMKTVMVNATAVRKGKDVVVDFTGGSDEATFKGEIIHLDLGQLKMPAEVWELFKAALMTLHRSQTEDYHFEIGVHYEQPRDGKYPEQCHLQIDPWYEIEEIQLQRDTHDGIKNRRPPNLPL